RRHRRRYGSRTGRPRAPAAGVPPPGRRGGVWFRAPAAGAERVGAGTLHRVSVRVYLLQAAAGLLREAAHLLRVLLDVSHRHPRGSGRLVEPNPRRGCGPDLEPVPGGPRGAFRARSSVLPDRASHPHTAGKAATALVTRVRAERETALAWAPDGALSALRGGGGVLGCDDRRRGLPGPAADPRAPAGEAVGADRVRDRCPRRARSGPRRRRTAAGDPPRAREHPRVLRAANRQRRLLSACRLRRAAARSLAARVRE